MNDKQKPLILVTNDDGILSPGIHKLAEALRPLGDVYIIAPDRERSAVSHSFTMHHPIRVNTIEPQVYTIDGTPADCVMFGARGFLERKPDLVASGINRGPNLGIDTIYSGTVAGAHEGFLHGIPSFAISMNVPEPGDDYKFDTGARFAGILARQMIEKDLPHETFLSVNVPNVEWDELNGAAITRLGKRIYRDKIIERTDPQGRHYYWIGGEAPTWESAEGCDFYAMENKMISVTPLGQDFTRHDSISELESWDLSLKETSSKS